MDDLQAQLTRAAVLDGIAPARRADLHRRVLTELATQPRAPELAATLAYHAEEAGDTAATLTYAVAAAEQAVGPGAHRAAAAQYRRALRHARGLPGPELAGLLRPRRASPS